jgi:hypothetical protein
MRNLLLIILQLIFKPKDLLFSTEELELFAKLAANSEDQTVCQQIADNIIYNHNDFTPPEYKTGIDWLTSINPIHKFRIIALDGWRNSKQFQYCKITKEEFKRKCKNSMVKHAISFDLNKF